MARRRQESLYAKKLWDENPSEIPLRKSRKRAVVLVTAIFFAFAVITLRLIGLMVIDHDKLSERAEQQYIREQTLQPQRGVIWDRKMREMAANLEVESLYAVPSKIANTRHLSRELAPLIKISSKKLNKTLLKKKQKEFIWLERKMDATGARRVAEMKDRFSYEGLGFLSEAKRYYPKGYTASHLMGFTNIDNVGISGLELLYDDYLKGEVSSVSVNRDARGRSLSGGIKDAVPGNNLVLTIDEGIQYIVERELAGVMKERKAKAAVAIMMDPATGEILAMANRPTYDPNHAGTFRSSERRNRAITDLFEPGSTLKAVLAAAAFEERVVALDEVFDVSKGFIVVGGKPVRDVHRSEKLTFQEVMQRSSNVGAVQIGLKLGSSKYYKNLRGFGF